MQAVQYASDAAGALYRWVLSHLQYAQSMEENAGIADLRVQAAHMEARFATASAVAKALHNRELTAETAMGSARRGVTSLEQQEQRWQATVADLSDRIAQVKAKAVSKGSSNLGPLPCRALGPPSWLRPLPKAETPQKSTEERWGVSRWNVHWLWQTET